MPTPAYQIVRYCTLLQAIWVDETKRTNPQISRYKAFKIIGLHPICATLFAVGYAMREVGSYNYSWQTDVVGKLNITNLIVYVVSQVLIFVAP